MNEFDNLEFLDFLSIISFIMQVMQIENNNRHMKYIEERLDHLVYKFDLIDDEILKSLTERYGKEFNG